MPDFWANVEPLSLSEDICHLNDRVRVCGFPVGGPLGDWQVVKCLFREDAASSPDLLTGGENISITEGIVSRVRSLWSALNRIMNIPDSDLHSFSPIVFAVTLSFLNNAVFARRNY